MSLFGILVKEAPNKVFLSLLLGILAGLSYALLMPLVLATISKVGAQLLPGATEVNATFLSLEISNYRFAIAYFCLFLFILIAKSSSQILMGNVAVDATTSLRLQLYKRISSLPVNDIESIGQSRLIVALTSDVPAIIDGVKVLPILLINTVNIIGILGFLVYLDVNVFFLLLITILLALVSYQIPIFLGERFFMQARHYSDFLQEAIRGLILGAKELKLNTLKRENFYQNNLELYEQKVKKSEKKAWTTMFLAITYGDLISFLVIGIVVFVLQNYYAIDAMELVGIVMAMLYIKGPISETLNVLPAIPAARVAIAKLGSLFDGYDEEKSSNNSEPVECWSHITLENATYSYRTRQDEHRFFVGPINFRIERGSVTYIVGGNGSGKSTLAKVMSLLYRPNEGRILFGGVEVNEKNISIYRQKISAIYLDFYLFESIMDLHHEDAAILVSQYLKELQLDNKVAIENNRFSTTKLSDGQKKRLALLVSLLEDRELYIFDEWAADQDPEFKHIFYTKILKVLKERKKTVIVITHDDRYFSYADKIVTMDNGKVRSIQDPLKSETAA